MLNVKKKKIIRKKDLKKEDQEFNEILNNLIVPEEETEENKSRIVDGLDDINHIEIR